MSTAAQVRRVFAELTRYPDEILDPDADLESDLGIDSVKRVEIVGRLVQVLELPPDLRIPERGLNTIGAITRFVDEARQSAGAPAVAPAPVAPPPVAPPPVAPPPVAPVAVAPVPVAAPRVVHTDGLSWATQSALVAPPPVAPPVAPPPVAPPPVAPPRLVSLAPQPIAAPAPRATGDLRDAVVDTLIEVLEETRRRMGPTPEPRGAPLRPSAAPRRGEAPTWRVGAPDLRGRVGLVTGSGRGLGAAIATAMAQQGCTVVLNSFHSREQGELLAARLRGEGCDVHHLWASVAQPDALKGLFGAIGERWGGLDFLVSNASDGTLAPLDRIRAADWDRAFHSNVVALHQAALLARPLMRARGGGRIVAVSSTGAQRVTQNYACMGPVKAAVEALVRYLAVDLGADNIQVNAIAPGPLYGEVLDRFPESAALARYWESRSLTGQLGSPEVIVGPLLGLLAPGASAMTGAVLQVDHGGALRI